MHLQIDDMLLWIEKLHVSLLRVPLVNIDEVRHRRPSFSALLADFSLAAALLQAPGSPDCVDDLSEFVLCAPDYQSFPRISARGWHDDEIRCFFLASGLRFFEDTSAQGTAPGQRVTKVLGVVEASTEAVFNLVMDLGTTRTE